MQQLEFEFFFPMTEQIPLDLDYSDCIPPKPLYTINESPSYGIGKLSIATPISSLTFNAETITFKLKEEPSLLKKILFKILNWKWEIK